MIAQEHERHIQCKRKRSYGEYRENMINTYGQSTYPAGGNSGIQDEYLYRRGIQEAAHQVVSQVES